ncbi:MAG: F0F1 ATP synthase subunit B [Ignavibacteriales bacterium]|nr:F0F1 ATP synthase subunit B [Ignavibacteriales bacterium]
MIAAIFSYLAVILQEEESTTGILDINFGVIFWTSITFILLLIVLKKFAWKPILKSLENREDFIKDSLEKAEKAKEEAEKLANISNEKIKNVETEAKEIIAQGREYSEKLKKQILDDTKNETKKMLEDAKIEIEKLKIDAYTQMKDQIALLAIESAEKVIKEKLDKEAHTQIINKYIKNMSGKLNE